MYQHIRMIAYAVALSVLIPFGAYYAARVINGPIIPKDNEKINTLQAHIGTLREKEVLLTKKMKLTVEETDLLSSLQTERKGLSQELASLEEETKQEDTRNNRITFLVMALVALLSLFLGSRITLESIAGGVIVGGTMSLLMGFTYQLGGMSDIFKLLVVSLAGAIIAAVVITSYHFVKRD
jgi:uncharacterized MnhB-related membrane protein